ncbi:MAG: deoxyhypusine synthase family protein [Candidatus Thermoplasmatota archaeon]|nr:deoxyhypusine synthase family protein [Candidatus Thermoplasmatota archaeon]
MSIREFIDFHFHHFNAGEVRKSATSLLGFLQSGGKLFITLAGAMSTARLGKTLAPLINSGYVAGISCTGANLEEDVFLLTAGSNYETIDDWRALSAKNDAELLSRKLNRVTDVCIPEDEAIRHIESAILPLWHDYSSNSKSALPHEFFYQILLSGELNVDGPEHESWVLAAAKQNLPLFVPGWEDSTLGNIFASHVIDSDINASTIKGGIHYMTELAKWYEIQTAPLAFFQIGGGIAGDFPICVVPMLNQDLQRDVPLWSWFCQISEATASYGGYSGAPPNEKITWGKLSESTPKFVIESDATIVAPLIFAYILDQ